MFNRILASKSVSESVSCSKLKKSNTKLFRKWYKVGWNWAKFYHEFTGVPLVVESLKN